MNENDMSIIKEMMAKLNELKNKNWQTNYDIINVFFKNSFAFKQNKKIIDWNKHKEIVIKINSIKRCKGHKLIWSRHYQSKNKKNRKNFFGVKKIKDTKKSRY